MMQRVKKLGQVWILGVLIILAVVLIPKNVYATQITGGNSKSEAVEIQPNVDYVSGTYGWFKITIPESAIYAGLYIDEFAYSGEDWYDDYNFEGIKECSGLYKKVIYRVISKYGETIVFEVGTSKAEQCKFKVVYGGEKLDIQNAKNINWNQEYAYNVEWETDNKYYKFVAPKSGYIRLRVSGSGWSPYNAYGGISYDCGFRYDILYKDKTELETVIGNAPVYGISGKEDAAVYHVKQGMTYYIKGELMSGALGDVFDLQSKFIIEDIPVSSIILNATSLTMKKGAEYLLEATVMPYNAVYPYVEFSSSNENVATVSSDGWITAKKAGTAIITVSSTDGSGIKTQCIVNVPEKKKLKVGQKITLNAMKYRVKSTNSSGGTVEMYGVSSKSKKSYKVPNKIKVGDYTYKVEKIGNKAFYNCKSATKITIGTNVKSIGKLAFGNCKKLKVLNINTKKLKSVGKQCFKNVNQDVKIYVPNGKIKAYTKLMKNKGIKWIK